MLFPPISNQSKKRIKKNNSRFGVRLLPLYYYFIKVINGYLRYFIYYSDVCCDVCENRNKYRLKNTTNVLCDVFCYYSDVYSTIGGSSRLYFALTSAAISFISCF